jgi:hypothetical protein
MAIYLVRTRLNLLKFLKIYLVYKLEIQIFLNMGIILSIKSF